MFYYGLAVISALFFGSIGLQLIVPVTKKSYKGQHVVVTGGSQGMGKAIAKEFVLRGADVTIIARTQATLDSALAELKTFAADEQSIRALSIDCTDAKAIVQALDMLGTPDVVFCCAGTAHPGLFVDLSTDELAKPMTGNYLSSMYTAHAALRSMLRNPPKSGAPKRKIIFTSSIAAFLNLSGYTAYTPTKAAIRALADTLRQECLMYDIDVHCVFPATIYSPGFENEQKLKPEITKILEEGDGGQTPEQVAKAAMAGIDRGYATINTEIIGQLLRCNMKGPSPKNGPLDFVYGLVASIAMPFVLFDFEKKVKKFGQTRKMTQHHNE